MTTIIDQHFGYDEETYPNIFTCTFVNPVDDVPYVYEISDRRNDMCELFNFVMWLKAEGRKLIGYNCEGFDYPILHFAIEMHLGGHIVTAAMLYNKAMEIINGEGFRHLIWDDNKHVLQIDIFKIKHFDNAARRTSLKALEFAMRSHNVEDLPFPPGTWLTPEQMDVLITYNIHDVRETNKFTLKEIKAVEFRAELGDRYTNFNDTKIGKQYFIDHLEKLKPGTCYEPADFGRGKMRQTIRKEINLNDAVLPWIEFSSPEFTRMKEWFQSQVITETKGVFKDLHCTVGGFQFDFGVGGIHGSVSNKLYKRRDGYRIIDLDVTSYYPSLAIANRLYPAHLGEDFCDIYADVKRMRTQHKKGTAQNAMLKLALNGVYGDSNNKYSPFYDPLYTMSITINGQLLLCRLAEMVMEISHCELIQINTDGLTVYIHESKLADLTAVRAAWESLTRLDLEEVEYNRMWVRDVNNYMAEKTSGGVKRKGAYEWDRDWHQQHSHLIIPKAAQVHLQYGVDIDQFIRGHQDIFDFMCLIKVQRTGELWWGEHQVQNVTRYYVSTDGEFLTKKLPPLAKAKALNPDAPMREFAVEKGFRTSIANNMDHARWDNIDYDWYAAETRKLTEIFK